MTSLIASIETLFTRAEEIERIATSLAERENDGDYPSSSEFQDLDDYRRYLGEDAIGALGRVLPVLRAVERMAEVLGDGMTAVMVGGSFTCGEAEALVLPLVLAGHFEEAVTWIEGHGCGDDDPEDEHADIHAVNSTVIGIGDETGQLARNHVRGIAAAYGLVVA